MCARRKLICGLAFCMALVGIGGLGGLFTRALGLPADAGATLVRVQLSLAPGHFTFIGGGQESAGYWQSAVMLTRQHDGRLSAFQLMRHGDEILMPDYRWFASAYACRQFGPAPWPGAFAEDAVIRCHDVGLPEQWRLRWNWTLAGQSQDKALFDLDLLSVPVSEEAGGWIVFGKYPD